MLSREEFEELAASRKTDIAKSLCWKCVIGVSRIETGKPPQVSDDQDVLRITTLT